MTTRINMGLLAACSALALLAAPRAQASPLFGVQNIDVPGAQASSTTAFNINNSGEIAGTYLDPAVGYRVFTYTGGTYATVDPPGSVNGSSLVSLNNSGQVVGFSNTATPPNYGSYYLAANGTYSAFPPAGTAVPSGASFSFLNDNGAVAGQTGTAGFISQNGVIQTIAPPNGTSTTINAINNAGSAVGGYFPNTPPSPTANQEGFLYANNAYTMIYVPGSTFTEATGISDNGTVVGYYDLAQTTGANGVPTVPVLGFTYLNGVYTSYGVAGQAETELFGINNSGQVVGYYGDGNGTAHGFEASTVPEPSSLLLAATGLLGMVLLRRRPQL